MVRGFHDTGTSGVTIIQLPLYFVRIIPMHEHKHDMNTLKCNPERQGAADEDARRCIITITFLL